MQVPRVEKLQKIDNIRSVFMKMFKKHKILYMIDYDYLYIFEYEDFIGRRGNHFSVNHYSYKHISDDIQEIDNGSFWIPKYSSDNYYFAVPKQINKMVTLLSVPTLKRRKCKSA